MNLHSPGLNRTQTVLQLSTTTTLTHQTVGPALKLPTVQTSFALM